MKQKTTIEWTAVTCGGPTELKELNNRIHKDAINKTQTDMEDHPCGCEICYANALLRNLVKLRVEHGLDPYKGSVAL